MRGPAKIALGASTVLALACADPELPTSKRGATVQPVQPAPARPPVIDEDAPEPARTVRVPLHLAAARRGPIKLHRLGDGELALSGGLLLARVRAGTNEVAQEPGWLAGLPAAEPAEGWRVHALGGRGEVLWLTLARGEAEFAGYRLRPGGWVPVEAEPGAYYADYTTWPEGHAIALSLGAGPPRLDVLDEEGARRAEPRFEAAGLVSTPRPTALAGLSSGELFAGLAADGGRFAGVLRWGPGEAQGHLAPLPNYESRAPRQVTVLVEGPGHDVLIGDSVEIDDRQVPYIGRFDGTTWRLLDPPPTEGAVTSLVEGAGPVIWAVVRGAGKEPGLADSLWRLPASGDWDLWERVEMAPLRLGPAAGEWSWDAAAQRWDHEGPAAGEAVFTPVPTAIGLDAGGELWVTARLLQADGTPTERHVALRSREVTGARMLLDDGQVLAAQQDLAPRRAYRAGDAACPQVFVLLHAVTVDSQEIAAPDLQAALAEGPLATALLGEVLSRGTRQVGLLLSASEADAARGAIAGLASRFKFKTSATCGHPPLLRGFRAREPE